MKKAKNKIGGIVLKIIGGVLLANIALFLVFFFDLDGKLLFNVVEPGLKKHYDNMERKDVLKESGYDVFKYEKAPYDM